MTEEILLLIGERIRARRQEKNITLEQLANKAGVTKGLISQIENNRTVPSLPVLLSIVHCLDENMKGFFEGLQAKMVDQKYFVIRKGEAKEVSREPVKGFSYKRIFSRAVNSSAFDMELLEMKPGAARRQMVSTEAYELKFLIQGQIEYQVDKEKFEMQEGDSLAFDGRHPHRVKNIGKTNALLLVIYLF
ncbi:helix-turn-helix domain-containing protein [Flavihumibacter sp. UBA7668]|uniref:helix-turn-helix domain-containing protein n=1 Tax=Flavihumibacter sp. UBA7668 TaxID=1946542 RepID=UPI0025BD47FD|nr:XRE family transcriptional regulator [Flavihumibacter sp. UBA7668]